MSLQRTTVDGLRGQRGESASLSMNRLTRQDFFAGLLILGCANGLASKIIQAINRLGLSDALFGSFDTSAIVWIACVVGNVLIFRDQRKSDISTTDIAVALTSSLLIILPVGVASWASVSLLSLYLYLTSRPSATRQGALVIFAVTVPMLWSRILFQLFAKFILECDASLVGFVLGTRRTGNMIEFADGSGQLVILSPCSSLANVSLAILCWVTISRLVEHRRSSGDIFWCSCACFSVVAVNVVRMSMMGLSVRDYETIHSNSGNFVVNAIILTVTVMFCLAGVRRELFARI